MIMKRVGAISGVSVILEDLVIPNWEEAWAEKKERAFVRELHCILTMRPRSRVRHEVFEARRCGHDRLAAEVLQGMRAYQLAAFSDEDMAELCKTDDAGIRIAAITAMGRRGTA